MQFLNKIFHFQEKGSSLRTEIMGGLITFVAMCYILPLNASILAHIGMNQSGVFIITAFVSFLVTMIMGLVANYPIVLSTGMGLNAYIAYTLSATLFPNWQQRMILLTIAGLLFFIFSLTPIRKKIIESIPKDLKCVISAALGAFIFFVGVKGTGLIADHADTLVTFGNYLDPAFIVGFISIVIVLGLSFVKNKMISSLAIPITVAFAAIFGLILSSILVSTGALEQVDGSWVYNYGEGKLLTGTRTLLPIAPWFDKSIKFFDFNGVKDVFLYGMFSDSYSASQFGSDFVAVIKQPATYVAIFSLIFVNLFDTTATLVTVGSKVGITNEKGEILHYHRTVLADSTGALICAPMGTSTVTSFAESNVGVSMGSKTGLSACVSGFLMFLCIFIYPVFSIFTAGSVTAAALVAVAISIIINAIRDMNLKDPVIPVTAIVGIGFAILTYSISNGIGMALITYCVCMLFSRRIKEVNKIIIAIAILFLVSFVVSGIFMNFNV